MQQVKDRFETPDGTKYGSIQSCIRTNDLELVGDGSHLTYFEMIGNFSFGGDDYQVSVELWDSIVRDLGIKVDYVTYHPTRDDHKLLWTRKGYVTKPDESCRWSDGNIGGFCCELFVGDLEIGNLVNPLDHSTDVGFGHERLLQVVEGKTRVNQTSLFRQDLHPIVSDHYRTLTSLRQNGISPGSYGRDYICRRLVRRLLDHEEDLNKLPEFKEWIEVEQDLLERRLKTGLRLWRRHKDKTVEWWKDTLGIDPDVYEIIKKSKGN
jgi:alanyl-tRNA synthetase